MAVKCREITGWMEEWAPLSLALDYDRVGLILGDPEARIDRILATLEVTPEVAAEAAARNVQLIISHHPLFRDPPPCLRSDIYPGSLIIALIRARINVYAAHTNLDCAAGGVSDILAHRIGLKNIKVLAPLKEGNPYGLGRLGKPAESKPLGIFAEGVKEALGLKTVRVSGDLNKEIKSIALCGGSGMSLLSQAIAAGADVYLTGDIKHHDALDALAQGLTLIDAGHHATERLVVPAIASYLQKKAAAADANLKVLISGISTDPFAYL